MSGIRWLSALLLCAAIAPRLFAQKVLPDAISDLSSQIAKQSTDAHKGRIAVVPFREIGGQPTVLGAFIAEELVTDLVGTNKFDLIERATLDKVIGELKLNASGAIDPATAKHIGQLAGADAIVTGTITDLQSYVAVNCRIVDTDTGRIFAAAETRIAKDDDVKKIMGAALESGKARTGDDLPGQRSAAPAAPRFETSVYLLTSTLLKKVGSEASLSLTVESVTDKPLWFQMGNCRLLDENGIQWDQKNPYEHKWTRGGGIELVPYTKLQTVLEFNTQGASTGHEFTLACTETAPQYYRNIVLRGIRSPT
jgi:TolB-like protein